MKCVIITQHLLSMAFTGHWSENCEILSNFSLEGAEEHDKQIDLCSENSQLATYDHIDIKSSIKQVPAEEENIVVSPSPDVELQEPSRKHSLHNEHVEILEEPLLQGSESLQRSDLLDNDKFHSKDDDISPDKEKETHEKVLGGFSTDGGDE
ncbi:uncharacterized protein LOC129319323 isoform X2 [Prosopis cineraria]|uniref:uncharacterized protein LOC129319323 isoform X2 n=1 Tax=Prosopis cineraria TaxID=364024 RepID=UPI0024106E22|nr:uncharacterized protein LOC129319323 isoform X2 [Prosopis cineraria]